MISRRDATLRLVTATAAFARPAICFAQGDEGKFDNEFKIALEQSEEMLATRANRDGLAEEFDLYETRAIGPRLNLSSRKISQKAMELIRLFEVSNKDRYTSKYERPIRPGGASGVTIGIGYDLGYVTEEWLREDWAALPGGKALLSEEDLTRLVVACKVKGSDADAICASLQMVRIDWDKADSQFQQITLARFIAQTLKSLPNSSELSDDSLGALVSLVYNRGPSFQKIGPRYEQMRNIHLHMVKKDYPPIPAELVQMAQLWANTDVPGLVTRRKLEAALFKQGLN